MFYQINTTQAINYSTRLSPKSLTTRSVSWCFVGLVVTRWTWRNTSPAIISSLFGRIVCILLRMTVAVSSFVFSTVATVFHGFNRHTVATVTVFLKFRLRGWGCSGDLNRRTQIEERYTSRWKPVSWRVLPQLLPSAPQLLLQLLSFRQQVGGGWHQVGTPK